jgi:hypothetical protein
MRTKTLLLTAAVGAAGIATSMAQVFSVNAVGYVNVTAKPGLTMIANPLKGASNKVTDLFAGIPDGTTIYKYKGGTEGFVSTTLDFGVWSDPSMTLDPGEGAFISNTGTSDITVTFVGEVPQGDLKNPVPAGFSIRSSQVPQKGLLDADLKFPIADGDTVYTYNNTAKGYDGATYDFGAWSTGAAPTIDVGQSFFVSKGTAASWDRSFSVN